MRIFRLLLVFLPLVLFGKMVFTVVGVSSQGPHERKIVVFRPGVSPEEKRDALSRYQVAFKKDLRLINGAAVDIPQGFSERLAQDPRVLRIDPDVEVYALPSQDWCERYPWLRWCQPSPIPTAIPTVTPTPTAGPNPIPTVTPAPTSTPTSTPTFTPTSTPMPISMPETQGLQPIPWGVAKIKAPNVWSITVGLGVKVAVVDTGIDTLHPDLNGNIAGGVNTVGYSRRYTRDFTDDNGHGTHVAGIIAALDNEIGVVGVGPKINLYAVKVLDRKGSGYLSDVIEGLDWAITNKMQVVNMSLGTSSNVQSFEEAVQRVNQAGITQVAAAGNSGGTVLYPAAYPEVIAVSATDSNNTLTSWSSRGTEVDLAAPGASIYSTYKGRSYATLSGTSMAAPHVAGTAALLLSVPDKCDSNSDGSCSSDEVQQRLEGTATDLGMSGKDTFYGAGLVNAYQAITAPR